MYFYFQHIVVFFPIIRDISARYAASFRIGSGDDFLTSRRGNGRLRGEWLGVSTGVKVQEWIR